jgi:membrane-associated phospholipid phosphatase
MISDNPSPSHSAADALDLSRPAKALRQAASALALQDLLLVTYLTIVTALVWSRGAGGAQGMLIAKLYATVVLLVVGATAARSGALPELAARIAYRFVLVGVLLYDYLLLRDLLPLVRPDALDATLLSLDMRVLGVEPALWLERYNQPRVVEWFAFFYFSYFVICGVYMLTITWFMRSGRQTSEFAVGTVLVYGIGQLGYMAVPGYGPIVYLAKQFHGPLQGGMFWGMVWSTVQAGGAMKDIFPSLHTAAPTWFTLYAIERARNDPRWRIPAAITAFFAANIVISTMLLRWHYAVDVAAGLVLSTTVGVLTPKIVRWESKFRARHGFRQPWDFS